MFRKIKEYNNSIKYKCSNCGYNTIISKTENKDIKCPYCERKKRSQDMTNYFIAIQTGANFNF